MIRASINYKDMLCVCVCVSSKLIELPKDQVLWTNGMPRHTTHLQRQHETTQCTHNIQSIPLSYVREEGIRRELVYN